MIIINVPESFAYKAEELIRQGLRVIIISDSEYIKRFGKHSLEQLKAIDRRF